MEDKEALRRLIKTQFHYQVTPEVLRELDATSRCAALSTGLPHAFCMLPRGCAAVSVLQISGALGCAGREAKRAMCWQRLCRRRRV